MPQMRALVPTPRHLQAGPAEGTSLSSGLDPHSLVSEERGCQLCASGCFQCRAAYGEHWSNTGEMGLLPSAGAKALGRTL